MSKDMETARICLLECIKGNLTGKSVQNPQDDKEEMITQIMCDVFKKNGKNLFIEWSVKYNDNSVEHAVEIWSLFTPDKTKDRYTLDTLIELARPYDTENKLPEDSYAIWKINHETTCFKVMERFYLIKNNTINSYNLHDIKVIFMHDEDNMKKWLTDKNIKKYTDINFYPPPLNCPDYVFNTWELVDKITHNEITEDVDITPFYTLFEKLTYCGADRNGYDYLIKWLAHLIKYPAVKPEICLFFTSSQGSGKDTFYKIIEKLIGKELVSINSQPANVFGKYNLTARRNKIVVVLQEADDLRKYAEEIKNVITCTDAPLADKGVKAQIYNDFTRLMIFSNNQNILKIDPDDRRFVIYHCYNFAVNPDRELFNTIYKLLDNPNAINKLRNELIKIDIPQNYSFKDNRPITEMYEDLKIVNTPLIVKWLWDFCNNPNNADQTFTPNKLCELYNIWITDKRHDFKPITNAAWGLSFKKYFYINNAWVNGIIKRKSQGNLLYEFSLETVKNFIESHYNYTED